MVSAAADAAMASLAGRFIKVPPLAPSGPASRITTPMRRQHAGSRNIPPPGRLLRACDAGLAYDLAPAFDLGADETLQFRGRWRVVGNHAEADDLLLGLRQRHHCPKFRAELVY